MSYSYEVGIIPLKDIEVVDRFRQDYGDLDSLRESIRLTNGIISAVAVKRNPEGSLFPFKLLAGGRRYFASLAEKAYELPARIYPVDTDEQSQLLIEKMENAQRKDFDWREVVSLDAALLKLLREKTPDITQEEVAKFLGKSTGTVSENLKLASQLAATPELFTDAGSLADARTVQKRIELDQKRERAARAAQSRLDAAGGNIVKLLSPRYIVSDVFDGLANLSPGQFDFLEIDPPYGIDLDKMVSKSSGMYYQDVADEAYPAFLCRLLDMCIPLMKEDSWLVLWQAPQRLQFAFEQLIQRGLVGRNIPLIWNRMNGNTLNPSAYFPHAYETALYLKKGSARLHDRGIPDVLTCPTPPPNRRIHSAERPLSMMQTVVRCFCPPGGMMLSPFLGSGVPIVAAHRLNITCMGFDNSESHRTNFMAKLAAGWDTYTNTEAAKENEDE